MIPQQQPEHDHDASLFVEQEAASAPDLQRAIEHFWNAVRKSAEVIVTLRQENTVLQSNLAVHKASEDELLHRVDQLRARIEELERDRAEQQARLEVQPAVVTVDTSQIDDLQATIRELTERYLPDMLSINIVPVALNRFREILELPHIDAPTPVWCRDVIQQIKPWQKRLKAEWDEAIVQLSDEFYVLGEVPLPRASHYGDFENVQDGVGGGALMGWEWKKLARKLPASLSAPVRAQVVTGKAALHIMAPLFEDLRKIEGCAVELVDVPSRFWGELITVTGLLTGQDLIDDVRLRAGSGEIWIPDIMLKAGTEIFLDDLSVADVEAAFNRIVRVLPTTAQGLFDAITGSSRASREDTRARFGNYEPDLGLQIKARPR